MLLEQSDQSISVFWLTQAALDCQLHHSSQTHLKAVLFVSQHLEKRGCLLWDTLLCFCGISEFQKHLRSEGKDSNTLMQKPQHLLHLIFVTELFTTNPNHSRSQIMSFKLSYMLQ